MTQKESSNLLAPIASKVMQMSRIEKLEKLIGTLAQKFENHKPKKKEIEVNPNFLVCHRSYRNIPIFYNDHPFYHDIGDRVICINQTTLNSIPFGLSGTVVGVEDEKFEIVFDKPFIGGGNLGGRCSYGRGAVMNFSDIYNLEGWNTYL